ncbi:hypothetical protein E4U34_008215 [Claviceps purpurea]|nr:hypothetical protein E4U34_008215 [Claviceps purpurea]KAG6280484.1 hypothetical protein E4U47_000108 [Claviceps purpurea]
MPHESLNNNEPEGSKDGRQWTSAEIFAFIGFLNDERNDGAPRNTTTNLGASETIGAIFKEIIEASGTEWNEAAKCFSLSDVQRAGFIKKYDTRGGKIEYRGLDLYDRKLRRNYTISVIPQLGSLLNRHLAD